MMDEEALQNFHTLFPNCSEMQGSLGSMIGDMSRGSPAGHSIAATFYLIWGLWWMFISFWTHIRCNAEYERDQNKEGLLSYLSHRTDDPLASKSWLPQPFLKKIPLEPMVKMALPGLGIIAESFFDVVRDENGSSHFRVMHYTVEFDTACGEYQTLSRLYHISLYLAFVISGFVDLLSLCLKLPKKTSPLFLCLAVYIQAHLFIYHVHGRLLFNIAIHQLINIFVVASAVFTTLRLFNPRNLFFNAGLAASMILQATHLYQAGAIIFSKTLYNPFSHSNSKYIAAVSTWHLLVVAMFMVIVFAIMKGVLSKSLPVRRYEMLYHTNGAVHGKRGRASMLENDGISDSEVEMKLNPTEIEESMS